MKFFYILLLVPLLSSSAFAQTNTQVLPTEKGTLDVGLSTIPENPKPGELSQLKIDFINPNNNRIQEHIDYRVTVLKEESNVFGPIPLTHTSTGSVKIPVEFSDEGSYFVLIEVEGILFQPIPLETVSFNVGIGNAVAQPSNDEKPPVNVGDQDGGGCLIATAALGSELSPQIQRLRDFRDNVVLKTESGFMFMETFNKFYYSFSPFIADYERQNFAFKELVKFSILPMINSLSILEYVEISSEEDMLAYGIGAIIMNIGLYGALPFFGIFKLYKFLRKQ